MKISFSFGLITILICAFLTGFSQEKVVKCPGFFRWDVKIMTDAADHSFIHEPATDSSVSQLVSVRPPMKFHLLSKSDSRLPRFSSEKYLVHIRANVVSIQLKGDRDLHIVLQDPESGEYMIGEVPDPDCSNLSGFPDLIEKYREARKVVALIKKELKNQKKPVPVEITGVPFWDARHWWLFRSAKNGREIHPILEIRML